MAPSTRRGSEQALDVDIPRNAVEITNEGFSSIFSRNNPEFEDRWKTICIKLTRNKRSIEIPVGPNSNMSVKTVTHDIMNKVEKELKSNLSALIYRREKAKIFSIKCDYDKYHYLAKEEMKRLKKIIGASELEEYVKKVGKILHTKDPELWYLMETIYNSSLKELLLKRRKATGRQEFHRLTIEIWNEWENMASVSDQDDLINYASCILREASTSDFKAKRRF